jgi:hypothetical protein
MTNTFRYTLIVCMACWASMYETTSVMAQYAAQLLSYDQGMTAAISFTTTPSAALGEPSRFTNDSMFPSVVSPFSPPFAPEQMISIGEGGEITLRLSKYAMPQAGGLPELGIFGNIGINDSNYPNGIADTPARTFSPTLESAKVEVSADGTSWYSFGNVGMDIPTNGYTNVSDPYSATPGTNLTDFQQPFVGSLSSFDGKNYANMVNLLAGSGGGKWLDISGTGLSQVGYLRFSIADDGNSSTKLKFELDAVSVSHSAMGGAVVPEPAAAFLIFIATAGLSASYCLGRQHSFAEVSGPSPTTPKA